MAPGRRSSVLVTLTALFAAACSAGGPTRGRGEPDAGDAISAEPLGDPDAGSPPDAAAPSDGRSESDAESDASESAAVPEERRLLCARAADDVVRDVFCKDPRPTVTSLRELAARLNVKMLPPEVDEAKAAAIEIDPFETLNTAVFLALSTALSGQLVSPINPRAILFNGQTFIAFQRGVQKVEIVTQDRLLPRFNFYLLSFAQACNDAPRGCLPGDLYTLSVERDWSAVKLEDDEDLKNTPLDCRMCHQRGAGSAELLMRELRAPWTHFFASDRRHDDYDAGYAFAGGEFVQDYAAAKGSETYAGIPAAFMAHTAGATLQLSVDNAQPLLFDAPNIAAELDAGAADGGAPRSKIWDEAYAAFKRGEQLALPHFEARPTDPVKQRALSEAYARYRRGEIGADALPDLADIFPDDPRVRAEIGLISEPGATPAETLIQACAPCHNDVLDQTLTRARFNVALARMSRAELDLAIARMELPSDDGAVMPPQGMRQLEPEAKKRLLLYLKQTQRPAADDAQLDAAAKLGMAKRPPVSPGL